MKRVLAVAGLALVVGQAPVRALETLPDRARVKFQGQYDVRVASPLKAPRRIDPRTAMNALSRATGQALAGTLVFEGSFDGPAVVLRASGTGGVRPARLTGTRRNGQCSLITDDGSTRYDGPCGPQGFNGRIASTPGNRDSVSGTFSTTTLSVVDIAAEEEARRTAAQLAVARQKAKDEQAAREVAALKARVADGDTVAMLAMAERYESGNGVARNESEAIAMLVAASKKGSVAAREQLKANYDRDRNGNEIVESVSPRDGSGEQCYVYGSSRTPQHGWKERWEAETLERPLTPLLKVSEVKNICKRGIWFAMGDSGCGDFGFRWGIKIPSGKTGEIYENSEFCGYYGK